MKNHLCKILFLLIALGSMHNTSAQTKEMEDLWKNQRDNGKIGLMKPDYLEISEDDVLRLFDRQPSFGMYKDNYFITGIPTNKEVSKYTADAKFQISIRQRLTKTVLPFNTFLMLTYTQKSFWNIYECSSPFADNNYNPGFALGKPIIAKNRLKGMATFAFEHESNGKDSLDSRSWNYFVLSGVYFFNMNLTIQAKVWAGWAGEDNPDIFKYRGYGLVALNYRTTSDRVWVSAILNPRERISRFNTQLEFNFKLSSKANQYLFVQWYQGYGESLSEYNKYTSTVRIGLCIKPPLRNLY